MDLDFLVRSPSFLASKVPKFWPKKIGNLTQKSGSISISDDD